MKKILLILLGLFFNYFVSQNLTDTENYVYKKTHLTDPSDPVQKQIESVQYLDGLGRPKQVISIKSTPLGQDMVVPIVYDQFGRKTKDYLPVPVQTSNAGIQTAVTENTVNSYYGVTNAFSEKELESSPLSRIFQSAHPGEEWKMNSGHTVKYARDANSTEDKVKKYQVTTTWNNTNQIYQSVLSSIVLYDENTLYKFSIKDEDNNEKIVFKDLYGHVLLIRKNDGTQNLDTYYVYDSNDHIAYVIPPLASVSSGLTPTILDNLCYQYRYDNKKRLVEKKLPGKAWEYMVYDKADRLVATKDTVNPWLFTKYDQLGRVVYTGTYASGASRISVQTDIDNAANTSNNETRATGSFNNYGMDVYYTNAAFPVALTKVLSVNYYDTYPQGTPSFTPTLPGYTVLTQDAQNSNISTKSLPVASYVKNIEDDSWTKNYIWYDTKGRTIGSHSINHVGGYTKIESELDFSGIPKQVVTKHKRLNTDTERVITENFTYDHQNRLLFHKHRIDNGTEEILSQNKYNELSQLQTKKVGGTDVLAPIQEVDYVYNIRGWVAKINDPADLNGKLFGYEIKYQNPSNSLATPKYNGNISEIDWRSANGDILKRYFYQYDGINRLAQAVYEEPSTTVPPTNSYGESVTYDINGNIKTLKRFSALGGTPMMIDDLDYSIYDGNKLIKVSDYAGNNIGYPAGGNTIDYDVNGNMISHLDKQIANINYNFLDLPSSVIFTSNNNSSLRFNYRADGTKIQQVYTYFNPRSGLLLSTDTNYLDGFQYIISALSFYPTAEGYYDFKNNRYVYLYQDQVGNSRLAYYKGALGQATIDKETNYYPFGMEYFGANGTYPLNNNYTYGFQEQERQEQTGWNSFKWRNYDPTLGRFFNVDPLSEVYAYQSHYNFSENRVVDAREIEGLEAELLNTGASFDGKSYDGGVESTITWSDGLAGAGIQEVTLQGQSTNQNNSSSFTWGDAGRMSVGVLPYVGSGLDIYEGVRDGNYMQLGIGIVGLGLDIAAPGAGSLFKGGIKTVGMHLVEEGIEKAAKEATEEGAEILIKNVDPSTLIRTETGRTWKTSTQNVAEIMNTAKEIGITTPVDIFEYGGKSYIINGHHRVNAAIRLGQEIPVNKLTNPKGYSNIFELQISADKAMQSSFKVDGRMLQKMLK